MKNLDYILLRGILLRGSKYRESKKKKSELTRVMKNLMYVMYVVCM